MTSEPYLALQVMMMPRDANGLPPLPHQDPFAPQLMIFGGVILSHLDMAGAIGARREAALAGGPVPLVVTAAINRVEFRRPVLVGDVVRFLTRLVRIGHTSITMHVSVEAMRAAEVIAVTEAELVYVAVDSRTRKPVPVLPAASSDLVDSVHVTKPG